MNKKTLFVKFSLIIILVIAITAVYFSLHHTIKDSSVNIVTEQRIDITPEQIQSIKQMGEWEFLSISDEEMVDTIRKGIFSDDHLVRIYYGTLRLGVNLHEVQPGWIKTQGDSVIVELPPIKLLDKDFIDEARTRAFYESGRWTPKDREAMYHRAYDKMLKHCMTPSNITCAENNADKQFRQLLLSMGFNNIIIRFSSQR